MRVWLIKALCFCYLSLLIITLAVLGQEDQFLLLSSILVQCLGSKLEHGYNITNILIQTHFKENLFYVKHPSSQVTRMNKIQSYLKFFSIPYDVLLLVWKGNLKSKSAVSFRKGFFTPRV